MSDPGPAVVTAADREALARLHAAEPVWRGIGKAADILPLRGRMLLHAGPPVSPNALAAPQRNSAIIAILFEGWAEDAAEAEALITAGKIVLAPAQDHAAVVPLAAILSPSMAVQIVADRRAPERAAYSPLNGGSGPAMRLGLKDEAVLERLRWLNGPFAASLAGLFDEALPLCPIADAALVGGDDCHGRTAEATRLLAEALLRRGLRNEAARGFLSQSPSFFLNLWMAASKCMASAAILPGSSVVTALGGNGVTMGLQLGGLSGRWFCLPAAPPEGRLETGFGEADRLGAIGDSAIVEAVGLGAMAISYAPEQQKIFRDFMDEGGPGLAELLNGAHPLFPASHARLGLAARRILSDGNSMAVALGILDRAGRSGRIGGGIYRPPLDLFAAACRELDNKTR